MTPEKEKALKEYIQAICASQQRFAIAKILYEETSPEKLTNLESIEATVRHQVTEYVSPEIGFFFQQATGTSAGRIRFLKSWIGELHLTNKQAKRLGVKSHAQISPYLEKCCLIVSANVSYENAAKDIKVLTEIEVSAKTQQRLVHRQKFRLPKSHKEIEELSVDGGKIRLRTPLGLPCIWRDYKGIRIHEQVTEAFFQDNQTLIKWVNEQPLASPVTCVGDGQDGIWNIISQIEESTSRREILDWFHLKENLYKDRKVTTSASYVGTGVVGFS